jgi:hypothetical protein
MDRRLLASAGPGNPLINWYRIQMDCCPLWIVYKLWTVCWTLSLFTLILSFYIFSVCLHFAFFLFIWFPAVKPPFFSLETSFSVQCKSKDRDRCEWWHPNISELCCVSPGSGGVAQSFLLLHLQSDRNSLNRMTHHYSLFNFIVMISKERKKKFFYNSATKTSLLNDHIM